ncbi:MAG TPA: sporulation protein YqfD [Eubacteriaceae bacterium]|nr:sporulation protein YqfD [Eubacteriaceae bacterium]
MLIVKLWHYFRGYVIIKIEGFMLEKFLNLVASEEIFLWDIIRDSSTCIYIKVGKRDFIKLKSIIKKVPCRIAIIDKKGLPFILWKMKKRIFLVMGASITLIIIITLTSFVWEIEVTGNKKIPTNIIIKQLNDLGLKKGKLKYKLSENELENKLIINNKDISYVHISIKGIKAYVEIVEKVNPPPILNKNIPTNVFADRDGIIHSMLVYGGEAMVKKGDLVKEGDLLISGEILGNENPEKEKGIEGENSIDGTRIHAWGDVYAQTWYEYEIEVKFKDFMANLDEVINEKGIIIGKKEILFKKSKNSLDGYDKIESATALIDIMGIRIPIYFKNVKYIKQRELKNLSDNRIKEIALEEVKTIIEEERKRKVEIRNSTIEIVSKDADKSIVKVTIEALENIAVIKEFTD